MREANPESLLIYKELVNTIHAICEAMNDQQVWALRNEFYNDVYAYRSLLYGRHFHAVDFYRAKALRDIREGLVEAGIIERRNTHLDKRSRATRRYVLNRSDFYEP